MQSLETLTKKLEERIEFEAKLNPAISQASVGWHIEHTLLTTDVVVQAIAGSRPEDYKGKFSFTKLVIFTIGKIPRGRIQSPPAVRPIDDINDASLKNHIKDSYITVKKLDELSSNHYFKHPYFGHLNLGPAKKFLQIHTAHHLSIIDDILKSAKN